MKEILYPSVVANVDGKDQIMSLRSLALAVDRSIYLTGEISDHDVEDIVTQLRYLDKRGNGDITFYINSRGGAVSAGLAIYDVMRSLHCDVCTVADANAESMAAILLAAGTRGKRFAAPNAQIMIHQPLITNGLQGQATDVSIVAAQLQHTKDNLASILAEACGKPVKTLINDMDRDHYLTACEAMEYGLVDHVGFPDREEEKK